MYAWNKKYAALGVSPAHFLASQSLLANNHASSRPLADSEIAGIRICEPTRRRCSKACLFVTDLVPVSAAPGDPWRFY
jgi:hypothetical protein